MGHLKIGNNFIGINGKGIRSPQPLTPNELKVYSYNEYEHPSSADNNKTLISTRPTSNITIIPNLIYFIEYQGIKINMNEVTVTHTYTISDSCELNQKEVYIHGVSGDWLHTTRTLSDYYWQIMFKNQEEPVDYNNVYYFRYRGLLMLTITNAP